MSTEIALHPQDGATGLMQIIARAANDPQMDVGKLQALLAVKKEWEADEARKAFVTAFAAFKSEAVRIVKNKDILDGPLRGRRYADLFAVVDSITPALSRHGLSTSWAVVRDDKDWIEVECILVHVQGHAERRKMGGPPDVGGAKNPIQARASAVTYLERYTFLASVGMAAAETDSDGVVQADEPEAPDPWTDALKVEAAAAASAGQYEAWWKKQPATFRKVAVHTSTHADMKAV